MTPLQHIQLHASEFTKSEILIMNYVMDHLDVISSYPIATVAEKCKVSKSALLRFCQKCGFRGYSEFKYEISRYLQSVIQVNHDNPNTTDMLLSLYTEQISAISNTITVERMNTISQYILQARKIKIYGIHETGLSAQYFCFRLCTLGVDAQPLIEPSNMAEYAAMASPEDVNIFLSLSAETRVICDSIKCSLENNCPTILITQNDHHKFRTKLQGALILPTFNYEEKHIFLDSQALVFITIDLYINNLAKNMHNRNMLNK